MSQYPSTWHWHALTHTAWGRSPHGSKAPADMLVKTLEPCWPNEIFQCLIQWLTNLQKKSAYMIIIYVHIMCATRSWVTKWVGLASSMDRNHQPLSWNSLDDVTWRSGSLSAWRPINIWDQRTVWFRIIIFGEKNVSCMLLRWIYPQTHNREPHRVNSTFHLQFNFQTRLSFLSRTFFRPWFELYHHNSICISFSQHSSKASLGNNIPRRFSPQKLRGLKPRNCGAWSASLPLGWQGKLKALGNLGLPGSWKHLKLGLKKDSWYELSKLFHFPFSDPQQKQTNICKSYKYLVKFWNLGT